MINVIEIHVKCQVFASETGRLHFYCTTQMCLFVYHETSTFTKIHQYGLFEIFGKEKCFNTVELYVQFITHQLALTLQWLPAGNILRELYSLQLLVLEYRPL